MGGFRMEGNGFEHASPAAAPRQSWCRRGGWCGSREDNRGTVAIDDKTKEVALPNGAPWARGRIGAHFVHKLFGKAVTEMSLSVPPKILDLQSAAESVMVTACARIKSIVGRSIWYGGRTIPRRPRCGC
jgi:hypothetical protein